MNHSNAKTCESYSCRLFMAGNLSEAKKIAGKFCRKIGWCVNITPSDYVYIGGQESGFVIEAINYARFPSNRDEINSRVHLLAKKLAIELNQKSYSVIDDFRSEYVTLNMPFEKDYTEKDYTKSDISKLLKSEAGRKVLADSMVEPIRRSLVYNAVGNVLGSVAPLSKKTTKKKSKKKSRKK